MLAILSKLVDTYPEIEEIDLNPVIVHENGASAVDSRILLSTIREPISPDEIY
jgi:acetyltransferase